MSLRSIITTNKLLAVKTTAVLLMLSGFSMLAMGASTSVSSTGDVAVGVPGGSTTVAQSGYGISDSFASLSPAQLDARMGAIRAAGATWVRYDLNWSAVQQQGPTSYDWSISDRVTKAAEAHDLHVMMILDLTPPWQRVSGCDQGERCAPQSANAFGVFAGAAAKRYKSWGVHTWEVWNEPNISYRFGPATDPGKYVAMLQASYPVIKRADPSAVVVGASTAPAASEGGDLRPLDFLRQMYADGAQGYFDAISVHPYTYPLTPAQSSPDDAWGQMSTMHQLMADNGDGDKKIWITEFGAPTDGPNVARDHVTEAMQAQTVTEAAAIFKQFDWSGPLFWYGYQDAGTSRVNSENFYGLVRANGTKKPSYDAFIRATGSN